MDKLIEKAFEFANDHHLGQKYGDYNYDKHIQDVFEILNWMEEYKDNLNLLSSAICHDVIEDCEVHYSELTIKFNREIAFNVWCVSDDKNGFEGYFREIMKSKTYLKTRSNPDAIIIKLADRIANVENSIVHRDKSKKFLKMYKEEHKIFRWNLYVPNHAEKLWTRLDKLIEMI